jgi:hypothetical protein
MSISRVVELADGRKPSVDVEDGEGGGLLGGGHRFPAVDLAAFGEDQRLKRDLVIILSSAGFWLLVIFLILADLAIFTWQLIYGMDSRLETFEALIAGLFMVELCLRTYAFDGQFFKDAVLLFDSVVVVVSFGLAMGSVNNPFLVGRSAR